MRYPDGENWMEQEIFVTQAFSVMADEVSRRAQKS